MKVKIKENIKKKILSHTSKTKRTKLIESRILELNKPPTEVSVKLKSETIDKGLLDEKLLSYMAIILFSYYFIAYIGAL